MHFQRQTFIPSDTFSFQDVVESVKVDDDLACELSVRIAVEMPYDIRKLECPTHEIRIKVPVCAMHVEF